VDFTERSVECSPLQLAFELIQEAPVRAVGNDLAGRQLNHAGFAQAERVEPDRIFRIVLAPLVEARTHIGS
jgi:hypothetical protein